jgi:hypothetical protein
MNVLLAYQVVILQTIHVHVTMGTMKLEIFVIPAISTVKLVKGCLTTVRAVSQNYHFSMGLVFAIVLNFILLETASLVIFDASNAMLLPLIALNAINHKILSW